MPTTIHKEGYAYVAGAALLGIIFTFFNFTFLAGASFILMVFFAVFFRDPDRIIPIGKGIVVAPSDGKVISIGLEKSKQKFVRIFMRPFDVHINRAPISGKITNIKLCTGGKVPAYSEKAEKNVQNRITISSKFGKIEMIQIAGIFGRRICCWIKKNQEIFIGERIGMIKFGSGTKVVLPPKFKILINEGDRVKAGETIIASLGK